MSVYKPSYRDPKTGKMKQARTWWFEFSYCGQRIRESAKTELKTLAKVVEDRRRKELARAFAGQPAENPKGRIRIVKLALADYKKMYPANHATKSCQLVDERSVHLEKHLGSLLALDLTEPRITEYMAVRKGEGASNRTINIELSVLSRAMGQKFSMMWPKLKRLEERRDVGRALSPEEEQAIVEAAARNRSRMIGPVVRIALVTGMRRDEIRLLKWSQIDFEAKQITVGRAKTAAGRGRVIPFGPLIEAVLTGYVSWYVSKLGEIRPDWHVFPSANRGKPVEPSLPLGSIKTAWGSVCDVAKVQCRFHDLRHTACTKMAEAGVPEATMQAIMGHMSRAMLER